MIDTVFFEGISMDFCRFGNGSKTLVVIPGLSVFKISPEEESLSKVLSVFTDDFTVYVFDRRNNIPENYSIEDMARDTVSAIKALNLCKIYLFGASQGGMIALSIAADHPELVARLVVASTAPGTNECLFNATNDLISFLKTVDIDDFNREMLSESGRPATKEDLNRSLLLAPSLLSCDLRPVLKNIKCRCLVIGSENDSVMSPDGSREIADLLGCDLFMYGAEYSHAVFSEAPDFHKKVFDFMNITEVAAALIRSGDKFMICQRPAHKSRGLLWEFVGGKVEPGESIEEALIRECIEELGVTISVKNLYMDVIHKYPDITVHLSVFNSEISEGTPKLIEHNDIKWISPSEIPSYNFCPADKDILGKILKDSGIFPNS